jgi:CRISPR-associated endonuclease/helicase Cas3
VTPQEFSVDTTLLSPETSNIPFVAAFAALTGHTPMRWQQRLFDLLPRGCLPDAIDLPTGLGKTSVMAIWLLAQAFRGTGSVLPRRLIYVVDSRVVVDQATSEAERIAAALARNDAIASELRNGLGLRPEQNLLISTLRGRRADDREWTYDAAAPAIVVGTIDMIGFCRSRETGAYAYQHFAEPLVLLGGVAGVTGWT